MKHQFALPLLYNRHCQSIAQERSAFLVSKNGAATGALAVKAIHRDENPKEGKDGESDRRSMNGAVTIRRQRFLVKGARRIGRTERSAGDRR